MHTKKLLLQTNYLPLILNCAASFPGRQYIYSKERPTENTHHMTNSEMIRSMKLFFQVRKTSHPKSWVNEAPIINESWRLKQMMWKKPVGETDREKKSPSLEYTIPHKGSHIGIFSRFCKLRYYNPIMVWKVYINFLFYFFYFFLFNFYFVNK